MQFVDRLAKTSVGKIDKKLLRETYAHIAHRQPPG
jgi:non-ribosomal peptide synthetase component E (peptide arylation enzyme)